MVKFVGFVLKRGTQPVQLGLQLFQKAQRRHLSGSGNDIVGGLAAVDVVVRVDERVVALDAAEQLDGAVGDDLVGVHVDGCAGAALHGIDDELLAQFSREDLVAGAHDGVCDTLVQQSGLKVRECCRLFDVGKTADELRVHPQPRDGEVFRGAQRLHAVIYVRRHVLRADGVFFYAVIGSMIFHFSFSCVSCDEVQFDYRAGYNIVKYQVNTCTHNFKVI